MGNDIQSMDNDFYNFYGDKRTKQTRDIEDIKKAIKTEAFNVEAVVFEGGGAKVISYVGAAEILEEAGMLNLETGGGIRKFAGTSGGSLIAAMLAMRMSASEIKVLFKMQRKDWIIDAWFSYLSLLPNMITKFGWNPSRKVEQILRSVLNASYDKYFEEHKDEIHDKVTERGNRDITFMDIYRTFGTELCVVSTNLTTRSVQYHHPKTTPDMSVISALRASISLPGLCQPVQVDGEDSDFLVDGGLMCNYPIHAYDGWFLSLEMENSFFKRIGTVKTAFTGANSKTIGFVVNSADENCYLGDQLEGVNLEHLKFPNTPLKTKREKWLEKKIVAHKVQKDAQAACGKLCIILDNADTSNDGIISFEEFQVAMEKSGLTDKEFKIIFGEKTIEEIMTSIDKNNDGEISFDEFLSSLENSSVLFKSLLGHSYPEDSSIKGFFSFGSAFIDTVSGYSQLVFFKDEDIERTCKINVWYVETADFDLEEEDRDFLIEQGRLSCIKFLKKRCKLS